MAATTNAPPKKRRGWSETLKNYWLDVFLFFAFVIDMNTHFTGIPIHEWLGVAFGIALIYHLMLHWKWIVSVTQRLFKKLPNTQRIRYLVDLALFVDMVIIVITGFWISRAVMPQVGLPTSSNHFFEELHHISAELAPIFVGLHLALDWKWIVTNTKKYLLKPFSKRQRSA
ncbi:MAG: cytochrome b/b6 domain-containing protein [Candidatus Promineifilaceae bacterium]